MVTLGTMLADAVERGLAARNTVRDMKRMRRTTDERRRRKLQVGIDIPSPLEARSVIHSAQGRWRPMIVTLIFTGLRSSEMRGLRWTDIDFDNRILHVRQRVDRYGQFGPPKSEAGTRSIPMPPFLVNTLREWKLACPPRRLGAQDLGLVFPNIEGRAITHGDLVIFGLIPTLARGGLVQQAHDAAGKPILTTSLLCKLAHQQKGRCWFGAACQDRSTAHGPQHYCHHAGHIRPSVSPNRRRRCIGPRRESVAGMTHTKLKVQLQRNAKAS